MLMDKGLLIPGEAQHIAKKVRVPGYGLTRFYCVMGSILAED